MIFYFPDNIQLFLSDWTNFKTNQSSIKDTSSHKKIVYKNINEFL